MIRAGEFLTYSVDASAAGTFTIGFRVANPGAAKTITVSVNGVPSTLTVPATGSFANWQTATLPGVNLNAGLQARVVTPGEHAVGDLADLIVVAMSRSSGEPLLALAQASLVQSVGQVPVLIISDRPFDPSPTDGISYLAFPFQVEELRSTVMGLLVPSAT